MREGGPGHPGDPDDIHIEDPMPFLVGILRDVADGADTGVVDQDVDAAEAGNHLCHRRIDIGRGGDVAPDRGELLGVDRVDIAVQDGHAGPTLQQKCSRRRTDTTCSAGHHSDQGIEFSHVVLGSM